MGPGCCFCLLVVWSVLWCVPLMNNRRMTKKKAGRKKDNPRRGQRQRDKTKGRPQRGCRFVCLYCFGVIWCDMEWYVAMYRDIISHVISISQDTIYRDIVSISRILRTDIEISYISRRNISRYWTLVSTTQAGKRIMRTDEGIHKKWKPNTDYRPTTA